MAKRLRGRCRVLLYEPGCRYQMIYEGAAAKTTAPEMFSGGRWASDVFDATGLGLVNADPDRVSSLPRVGYVALAEGRGAFSSVPYLDGAQEVGIGWWDRVGGIWEELTDPEYGGKLLHQRDARVTAGVPVTASAESTFHLPVNPQIELCLWRGEPSKDCDRLSYPPSTRVQFGRDAEEFSLVIPYGGEAAHVLIHNRGAGRWERLEMLEGSLPAYGGIERGHRIWLSISCCNGVLCVSFSRGKRGESQTAYFSIPSALSYPDNSGGSIVWKTESRIRGVNIGPLRIVHTGGQLAFRWWPIYHAPDTTALHYVGTYEAGYPLWSAQVPQDSRMSTASCDIWQQVLWEPAPGGGTGLSMVPGSGATVIPFNPGGPLSNPTGTQYTWRAEWEPTRWKLRPYLPPATTGPGLDYCQSPLVFAVQCRAAPYVHDYGDWPAAVDISGRVVSVLIEYSEDRHVGMARLGLRNEGGAFLSVKSSQLIEIELGYLWDDGSDELSSRRVAFVGYVQTPGKVARVGPGETCDLVAYCPFIRLRDERAHSNEPDFQVSSSKDAVHWLAARAGFSDDQMLLEGSDDRMFLGLEGLDQTQENGVSDPMNSSLMPAFGTELLDSVDEYTRRDGESLIWVRPYDVAGEGFLLCKSNGAYGPTDGVLFSLNESAGPCNPAAPTYHLYELSVEQVPMDPEQYSDLVVVRGKTPAGEYVQATCADLARVADPSHPAWSGGWRHMHCEARDHLQSPALLQQRANELFSERSRLPAVATVETDLLWYDVGWRTVHKGDRFVLTNAVNAGKAYNQGVLSYGATVKQFRVVGFRHFWDGPGTMPRTVLIGRAMWA